MANELPPLDGLDLNLLVTLRALLRESSVTRAAGRLGQTQPTVSRALASLRLAFGDPLLVRSGRGMALTPVASALRAPLERSLAGLDRLRGLASFQPATAERTFRLIMTDILAAPIMRSLMTLLQEAPGVRVQFLSSEQDALTALLADDVDIVVHAMAVDHPELYNRTIGAPIGFVTAYGPLHPAWGADTLGAEAWLESPHVQLIPGGRPNVDSPLDDALAARGLRRDIRFHVSHIAAIAPILEAGPYVATLPTLVAHHVAAGRQLRVSPHPFPEVAGHFRTRLSWHGLHHRDEGHAWLRNTLAEALDRAQATA